MESELVRLDEIVKPDQEYQDEMQKLEDRIDERDIPSWILVRDRSSGEHPTGGAWLGVVMARCSEGSGNIDARVAIDVEDRDRVQSNVGSVPDALLEKINQGITKAEKDVELCVARIQYDTSTRQLDSVNMLLELVEREEEEEED